MKALIRGMPDWTGKHATVGESDSDSANVIHLVNERAIRQKTVERHVQTVALIMILTIPKPYDISLWPKLHAVYLDHFFGRSRRDLERCYDWHVRTNILTLR
jgi:hypothetical protein